MTSIADDYVHLDNEDTTTHLVKVVFVGDAGVGKTCLLNRLFTDEFNAQCPATIGCDFRFKRYTFDSKNVGVTLWDTAGAERFQSITTSYYRGAQGIVFVFDVTRRETFDSLQRYWLDEVAAHLTFPDAVRMIIGNKVDSASRRQVDSEEAAAFARKHGCMYQETSAKTDHNVHDALVWGLVCTIVDTPSLLRSTRWHTRVRPTLAQDGPTQIARQFGSSFSMLSNLRSLQGSASIHRQRCSIQLSGLPSRNSNIVSGSICASSAIRAPVSLRSRASSVSVVANAAPAKTSESSSTVRMVIQGRRLKVTDPIKAYVEEKVSKAVENYKQAVSDVHVTLSVRGGDTGTHGRKEQRAEVTIRMLRNGVVRVEDAEESLYAAIDIVCDKIARKLGKVKDKAIIKGKWAGRAGPKGTPEDEADFQNYKQEVFYETRVAEEEQALEQQFALLNSAYPATVRRTKVLDLEPISVDDAIEAMEQVGHDFYVFRELESDEIQVVYKRAAEGYGVLVPHKKD